MERALKILSAMYATAAGVLLACIIVMVVRGVVPNFAELEIDHRKAALTGLVIAYGTMFLLIYALAARLIWRRERWKKAMLLAAASCFGIPIGPVLGVAAMILLTRPPVRKIFAS